MVKLPDPFRRMGARIGVGDGGRGALEINSGKFEIIRALNFGEDLFLETPLFL